MQRPTRNWLIIVASVAMLLGVALWEYNQPRVAHAYPFGTRPFNLTKGLAWIVAIGAWLLWDRRP